ncbi:T9SS type A sorting domain-containing protein [Flavobacterium limnosediminis]|nr:T9SS type A sorting domain-containing protein [Flavobacterium limnosediminis]
MKKIIPAVFYLFCLAAIAQVPPVQWQKTFGGSSIDHASSVQLTQDGGYIIAGGWSFDYCGQGSGSFNGAALKIDGLGNLKWHTCLELPGMDYSVSIQAVPSGGFIMLSVTDYNAFDFILDPHVMKISDSGDIEWNALYTDFNSFGVMNVDFWDTWPKGSIQNTPDGGYIVAGSKDSDFFNFPYIPDCAIMKLNSTGAVQWENYIGSSNEEFASSIQNTPDGNYIFAGGTKSFSDNHGLIDFYVVKINNEGTVIWQKRLGGAGNEIATSVQVTSDGGYIVAGYTTSNNGNVSGNHGGSDVWVVKLDSNGTILWQKCLGGTGNERASSIQTASDGGYIVAGHTNSNDGNVSGNHGDFDAWVVKLDSNGTIRWQKCFGGSAADYASSIQVTTDGGYIFAGETYSNDGDVASINGGSDIWVVKLGPENLSAASFDSSNIRLHPNPVNDFLHFSEELQTIAIFTINSQKIIQATNVEKIDLSALPAGMYFIKIENNAGNISVSKILKN